MGSTGIPAARINHSPDQSPHTQACHPVKEHKEEAVAYGVAKNLNFQESPIRSPFLTTLDMFAFAQNPHMFLSASVKQHIPWN